MASSSSAAVALQPLVRIQDSQAQRAGVASGVARRRKQWRLLHVLMGVINTQWMRPSKGCWLTFAVLAKHCAKDGRLDVVPSPETIRLLVHSLARQGRVRTRSLGHRRPLLICPPRGDIERVAAVALAWLEDRRLRANERHEVGQTNGPAIAVASVRLDQNPSGVCTKNPLSKAVNSQSMGAAPAAAPDGFWEVDHKMGTLKEAEELAKQRHEARLKAPKNAHEAELRWHAMMAKHARGAPSPRWSAKSRGQAKGLVQEYDTEYAGRLMAYAIHTWATLRDQFREGRNDWPATPDWATFYRHRAWIAGEYNELLTRRSRPTAYFDEDVKKGRV